MTDVQTTTGHIVLPGEGAAGPGPSSTRRCVLLGAGAVGATAVLAACGTSATGGNTSGTDYSNTPAPAGSKGAAAGGTGNAGGAGQAGGVTLAKVADVPVGGGYIGAEYVVTQPTAGTFKAFDKTCTHAGCDVSKVDAEVITCPCHNSTFSIKDGSPTGGPARQPLKELAVKAHEGNVVTA
jgi:Rieske Fe-S protein